MRRTVFWVWILLLMVVLVACRGQTTAGADALPPLPTLESAQIALGRDIYRENCASCHGTDAEGAPNWATLDAEGLTGPPPHDDSSHTWHHSDRVLYESIYMGMGDPLRPGSPLRMPAFGDKLSDTEIRAVVEYFKSLWSEESRLYQWEETVKDSASTQSRQR